MPTRSQGSEKSYEARLVELLLVDAAKLLERSAAASGLSRESRAAILAGAASLRERIASLTQQPEDEEKALAPVAGPDEHPGTSRFQR